MHTKMNGSAVLFGILIPLMLLSTPSYAKAPSEVNVSIYTYNIRGFDVATGQYAVDFYLHFKWNTNEVSKNISD